MRKRVWIIGAGAFQSQWEEEPRNLGFGPGSSKPETTVQFRPEGLPTEIRNRFRDEIIVLDPSPSDYQQMICDTVKTLPRELRQSFAARCKAALPQAIAQRKGARFIEECLLQALLSRPGKKRASSQKGV